MKPTRTVRVLTRGELQKSRREAGAGGLVGLVRRALTLGLGTSLALALLGCGSDSGSVSINNGTSSGSVAAPNAAQSVSSELTNAQGLQLLKDLQTNPNKRKTLTPAELRFLAKAQLAEKERKARN